MALESFGVLSRRELDRLLRDSYDMVFAKLPKKAQAALDGADEVRGRLAVTQAKLNEVRSQLEKLQRSIGGLEERHEEMERKAGLRTDKAADLGDAHRDRDAFADLTMAFGKRGIQALVIEQALPELEQMANDVLGRMTDGRMTVRLDSMLVSEIAETYSSPAGAVPQMAYPSTYQLPA